MMPPVQMGGGEMLVVDMIARVRRAHFVDGKSIKQITREFDLARNTVRRVLRSGETAFSYERAVQPRPQARRVDRDA